MKTHNKRKFSFKGLLRDERGIAAIYLSICLPFFAGLLAMAVDMSYVMYSRNLLQVTAESAALAATTQLPSKSAAITIAKQYAEKNMPSSRYGSVLADVDVVVGKWTDKCPAGGQACFQAAGSQDCTSFKCNAVQVTTREATSNGNAFNLVFGPLMGSSSFNIGSTAIATYGPGPGSQTTWNVVVVEDISMSFSQQLPNAKAADLSLLDCIRDNAAAGSKLGITLFTGVSPSPPYQAGLSVSDTTNYNNLKSKVSGINQCGSAGMPPCSGSNVSSGMNSAITQFCPTSSSCQSSSGSTSSRQALVIITDGIPNCGSTRNCSDSQLLNNAVTAANNASSKGIDVFTIYYGTSNSDAAWLATLVRGNGIALKTPDPTKLADLMQQVCSSSLSHRLVW